MFYVSKYSVFMKMSMFMKKYVMFIVFISLGYLLIFFGGYMSSSVLVEYSLWDSESLRIGLSFYFDFVTLIFIGTIGVIGGSVCIYTHWYMDNEVYFKRFMFLVYLFVGSMLFMITIPNLIILLIGWDGLGLTSFLLVCFYQNNKSLSAGMITALTNRIGDVLILTSIGLLVNEGTWLVFSFKSSYFSVFLVGALVFGGMTKSAQMPFCAWLPAAMAAPTPVSSLVHSSTLVTAGVYLLIRSYYIISHSLLMMDILKYLSLFTLVLAGSSAIMCMDMKKVIALSTLSQLSVMMFALSMKMPSLSFFHLVIHAIFKALLFLSAGAVIHSNKSTQDIRMLGGCWMSLPFSMCAMTLANASLCGIPFMSGFYSKDMVVDMSYGKIDSFLVYFLMILGLMFTSIYSLRMMLMTMFNLNKSAISMVSVKESLELVVPYFLLGVGAIFSGDVLSMKIESLCGYSCASTPEMIAVVSLFIYGILYLVMNNESVFFHSLEKFEFSQSIHKKLIPFLLSMWFMEFLTSHWLKMSALGFSSTIHSTLDKGWCEKMGPQGVYETAQKFSQTNEMIQSFYFLSCISVFFVFFCFFLSSSIFLF